MYLAYSLPLAADAANNGLVTTIAVLGGLAGIASLIITLMRGRAQPVVSAPAPTVQPSAPGSGPSPAAPAPVAAPAATAPSDAVPPEILAVIAAAVAVTVGPRARIAAVAPTQGSIDPFQQAWSVEGRRQIYSSHQIR